MGHRHRHQRSSSYHRPAARRPARLFRPGGRRWYRVPEQGKLSGICAGLAEYYDITPLMMRGLTVTAALFMPQLVICLYIAGVFFLPTREEVLNRQDARDQTLMDELDEREADSQARAQHRTDRRSHRHASRATAAHGDDYAEQTHGPSLDARRLQIRRFKERMGGLEGRLQGLERHVTSRRFDLAQEIDKL